MQSFHAIRPDGAGTIDHPWFLFDESPTGGRLKTHYPERVPDEFELLIGCSHTKRRCFVVWRSDNEVGLRLEPVPEICTGR